MGCPEAPGPQRSEAHPESSLQMSRCTHNGNFDYSNNWYVDSYRRKLIFEFELSCTHRQRRCQNKDHRLQIHHLARERSGRIAGITLVLAQS